MLYLNRKLLVGVKWSGSGKNHYCCAPHGTHLNLFDIVLAVSQMTHSLLSKLFNPFGFRSTLGSRKRSGWLASLSSPPRVWCGEFTQNDYRIMHIGHFRKNQNILNTQRLPDMVSGVPDGVSGALIQTSSGERSANSKVAKFFNFTCDIYEEDFIHFLIPGVRVRNGPSVRGDVVYTHQSWNVLSKVNSCAKLGWSTLSIIPNVHLLGSFAIRYELFPKPCGGVVTVGSGSYVGHWGMYMAMWPTSDDWLLVVLKYWLGCLLVLSATQIETSSIHIQRTFECTYFINTGINLHKGRWTGFEEGR